MDKKAFPIVYEITDSPIKSCFGNYALGCFRKNNPPSISLGVTLKVSKRIFDFDKV